MSTQITGFILEPQTDIFALSRKVREVFLPVLKQNLYNELLEHIVSQYDMATYSADTNKVFRASNEITKETITFYDVILAGRALQKQYMDNMPDSYQVQLGFMPDPLTGHVLCAWFGNYELREQFAAFEEVHDFSYWNSSEQPDGISDEEWEERCQAWDRALLPSGHVSSSALMSKVAAPHELSVHVSFADMKEANASLPSREWRVKKLVEHFISNEWLSEQDGLDWSFSGMMAALRDPDRRDKWTRIVNDNLSNAPIDFEKMKEMSMQGQSL